MLVFCLGSRSHAGLLDCGSSGFLGLVGGVSEVMRRNISPVILESEQKGLWA